MITEIERQASRMRLSLEAAMCRGDAFTGTELRRLLQHPVLAPMLCSLILVGPGDLTGYAVDGGQSLEAYDDTVRPVSDKDLLKIAHAHDLLTAGYWQEWQRECFQRERIQPFKQVFRELYVLTAAESCRFSAPLSRAGSHRPDNQQGTDQRNCGGADNRQAL